MDSGTAYLKLLCEGRCRRFVLGEPVRENLHVYECRRGVAALSTQKDTLATDYLPSPEHDLGMAVYLGEWLRFKRIDGAELADAIGCSRSLVSKWVTKKRPLRDINWISKICAELGITQEDLCKMPPKIDLSLRTSSAATPQDVPPVSETGQSEGIDMIEERLGLIESIDDLPDELIPTARKLIDRLRRLKGSRPPNPSRRGSTKT